MTTTSFQWNETMSSVLHISTASYLVMLLLLSLLQNFSNNYGMVLALNPAFVVITPKTNHCMKHQQKQSHFLSQQQNQRRLKISLYSSSSSSSTDITNTEQPTNNNNVESTSPSQTVRPSLAAFNGKRILPYNIVVSSLSIGDSPSSSKVAAVYAVLNSSYNRNGDGWDVTEYIGITQDIRVALTTLREKFGSDQVAHVRIAAFDPPEPLVMQRLVQQWKELQSTTATSTSMTINFQTNDKIWSNLVADALSYVYDDIDNEFDDDDDDDDYDSLMQDLQVTAQAMSTYSSTASSISSSSSSPVDSSTTSTVVSPFQSNNDDDNDVVVAVSNDSDSSSSTVIETMSFNKDNVDIVLNEVRPYLISDGGNVAVVKVDDENNNVYLKLEGACGSCPSSTVTMKMGIERVLKEKFPNISNVISVSDDEAAVLLAGTDDDTAKWNIIQKEIQRLQPAITGMGCSMELKSIDKDDTGIVTIMFRGSQKVRKGVELAILDVPFVTAINFISE